VYILLDSLSAGIRGMFDQFILDHRQAKDEWDAIWLSMKNSALQRLQEILESKIVDKLINLLLGSGGEGGKKGFFKKIPIIGDILDFLGFQHGGKNPAGQIGILEGITPELVAPEKDFYDVARAEIIPRIILETRRQAIITTGSMRGESRAMDLLESIDNRLKNLRLEVNIDGRKFKAMFFAQDEFDSKVGLKTLQ
jgi:hypothetical protein